MSNAILPKWPGQGFPILKTPRGGKTIIQESTSGKEVRLALWSSPDIWDFELTVPVLRSQNSYLYAGQIPVAETLASLSTRFIANDFYGLAGFFMARQGSFDSWLYDDPTDNAITQAQIGTGNGSSTQFQAARQVGEFSEYIQNLNGTPIAAPNWQPSTPATLLQWVLPSLSQIQLQMGRITPFWQTPGWPCFFAATTAGTTGAIEPNWRLAPLQGQTITDGTVIWTNLGVATVLYIEQALPNWIGTHSYAVNQAVKPTSGNAGGFTYICDVPGTSGSSAPTWQQSLGAYFMDGTVEWHNYGVSQIGTTNPIVPQLTSTWSVNATGLISLTFAPGVGAPVRLTSGFFYRCRFAEDMAEFKEVFNNIYSVGKLKFHSLKL